MAYFTINVMQPAAIKMAYYLSKLSLTGKDHVPILQQDFPVVLEDWALRGRIFNRLRKRRAKRPAYSTAPDPREPKWKQARRANQRKSLFLRLPYELLLDIFAHLDPPTLFVLRQTCSNFLYAMDSDEVRRRASGEHTDDDRRPYLVFAHPDRWHFADSGERVVDHLRQFDDQLCSRCRWSYKSEVLGAVYTCLMYAPREFLWCRGCAEFHGFFHFSSRQRKRSPIEWICVGREGSMPLCQHKSISWDDVSSLAAQQTEGTKMTSAFALSCRDPKHTIGKHTRTWCKVSAGDLPGSFNLDVVWLQAAFDLDPAVPVTREHIRRFLAAQTNTVFGTTFCPHVKPNDRRLLLPFVPSVCVCFVDGADADAAGAATGPMHTHDDGRPCCRCAAQRRPGRKRKPVLFLSAEDGGCDEQTWDQDRRHAYTCSQCEACYTWVREWQSSRVYLRCHRRLRCQTSPASKRWLKHINPASWQAADDSYRRRKNLIVCETPGCQTQARWTALLPGVNWAPVSNWQWAAPPLQLLALRDTRLREEAALEGVPSLARDFLARFMQTPAACAESRFFAATLMQVAERQPSPRMLAAVQRMKAASAVTKRLLVWGTEGRHVQDEAPASWAMKTKQQTESAADMVNMYRVYPGFANPDAGSLMDRFSTAFQLLQLDEKRRLPLWFSLGLPSEDIVGHVHDTYINGITEWLTTPAATPEIEQARRVARNAARQALDYTTSAGLRTFLAALGRAMGEQ